VGKADDRRHLVVAMDHVLGPTRFSGYGKAGGTKDADSVVHIISTGAWHLDGSHVTELPRRKERSLGCNWYGGRKKEEGSRDPQLESSQPLPRERRNKREITAVGSIFA
jgi:hypothetical protein